MAIAQAIDEADDVVLQELFLLPLEQADDLATVGGVGAGQAEVHRLAARRHRDGLQAELGGAILVLGERFRIDHAQAQLALGVLGHFFQQLADSLRISARFRIVSTAFLGEEEIKIHRLGQRADDLLGAGRERIQLALGQVEARAAQHERDENGDADEQQGEGHERTRAIGLA